MTAYSNIISFNNITNFLQKSLKDKIFQCCSISIGNRDGEIFRITLSDNEFVINEETLFDMASVTKILSTTFLALVMIDSGELKEDNTLGDFYDCNEDKKYISVKHLLTHTSGISSSYLIKNDAIIPENAVTSIINKPLVIPTGSDVIYSCPGYIVLGDIIEKIKGKKLDVLSKELIFEPLGMNYTGYLPESSNVAATRDNGTGMIVKGIVNDRNARFLDGIAGNAGVFSNIIDMSKFAILLSNRCKDFISNSLFEKAISNHTQGMSQSRGLGFNLADGRYKQTGNLFSTGSFGHTGYTGTSVFVDIKTGLYVVFLSNRQYYKCTDSEIKEFRCNMHNAIYKDIET